MFLDRKDIIKCICREVKIPRNLIKFKFRQLYQMDLISLFFNNTLLNFGWELHRTSKLLAIFCQPDSELFMVPRFEVKTHRSLFDEKLYGFHTWSEFKTINWRAAEYNKDSKASRLKLSHCHQLRSRRLPPYSFAMKWLTSHKTRGFRQSLYIYLQMILSELCYTGLTFN